MFYTVTERLQKKMLECKFYFVVWMDFLNFCAALFFVFFVLLGFLFF